MKRETLEMDIKQLIPLFILIGVAGIVGSFTTQVQGETRDDVGESSCAGRSDTYTSYNATADKCYNSSGTHIEPATAEWNISSDAMEGNANLAARMGTIGLIAGIVIVLVLLVRGLGGLGGI